MQQPPESSRKATPLMSEQEPKTGRWKAFTSLDWYDGVIEFLFRFVAKTSEPLLAAGIVYSAADVLSKGHLGSTNPLMDNLWALSQALAIESSGGVVLVYGLQSIKEKDRVKAWMYFILSALLAITGGVMLYMQLAGLENQQPDSPLMRGLFALRCVVSVGYIYLCRTKAISFRDLDSERAAAPSPPTAPASPQEPASTQIDYQRLAQELAPLLQAVRTTIIEEVKASMAGPENAASCLPARRGSKLPTMLMVEEGKKQEYAKRAEEPVLPVAVRLEIAYQELAQASQGRRISGRALAKHAHVDRQTCATWLKATHPEKSTEPEVAATASQSEAVVTATEPPPATESQSHLHMVATTTTGQPGLEATATASAATDSESQIQPNTTTTEREAQPEITATDQPQPETTATMLVLQLEEEATIKSEQAATTGQPEAENTITQTASQHQSKEEEATTQVISTGQPEAKFEVARAIGANQQVKKVTATVGGDPEAKKAVATPPPRKKATTTRKAAQSQPKATM